MKKIMSKDNEKMKLLKKLQQKKYRDKVNQFVVENIKIVVDAFEFGVLPETLFITENFKKKNIKIIELLDKEMEVCLIDDELSKKVSSLDASPGVLAMYQKSKNEVNLERKIIYLNGVGDPGNVGTILRTALAFGFENIVIDEQCADVYSPKTIQAAKDAVFKLKIEKDADRKMFKKIKNKMKVYSTRMEDAVDVRKAKLDSVFCLVIGSEAHGVGEEIMKESDGFIRIEISDEMESLNVAVATGIVLHCL